MVTTSTIEYIRYRVPVERAAEFAAAYAAAAAPLARSPFFLGIETSRCIEEPDRWVVRIEWTSIDDHLQGFRPSPEFGEFIGLVRAYFPMIEEMQHYLRA